MKLRNTVTALLLLPFLLVGCDDDPSGPKDEIYTLQTVQVNGTTRPLPAMLYSGPAIGPGGVSLNIEYQVRQGTLLLFENGRYEFSGSYRLRETSNPPRLEAFNVGAVEFGTYTRTPTNINFRPDNASDQYLASTATLQQGVLTVNVMDPLFEEEDTYTFGK